MTVSLAWSAIEQPVSLEWKEVPMIIGIALGVTATSTGGGVSAFAITIDGAPITIDDYQITITGVL